MLRHVIEREVVTRCVRAEGELDWTVARAALAEWGSTSRTGDVSGFADPDLDFHSAVYLQSGHRHLDSVRQQYRPTLADMLTVTNTVDRDLGPNVQDHADCWTRSWSGGSRSRSTGCAATWRARSRGCSPPTRVSCRPKTPTAHHRASEQL